MRTRASAFMIALAWAVLTPADRPGVLRSFLDEPRSHSEGQG